MEDRYLEDHWKAKQITYDMAVWMMKREQMTWAQTLEVIDRLNEQGLLDVYFTNYHEEKQFERDRQKFREKYTEE